MKKVIYTCDVCGDLISNAQSERRCFICGRMMCPDDTFSLNIGDNRKIYCTLCKEISIEYVNEINEAIKYCDKLKNSKISEIVSRLKSASIKRFK